MRGLPIFILLNLYFNIYCYPQNILWQKCYGGSGSEGFYHISTIGSNFIVEGYTDSNDGDVSGNHGGSGDLWLIQINNIGDLNWQNCYGGSNQEGTILSRPINHGRIFIAGGTRSNDGDVTGNHAVGFFDGWSIMADSSGNILWQKCYGGTSHDGFDYFIEVEDGFVMVGSVSSNDGDLAGVPNTSLGLDDIWVMKIDTAGIIQWQKCYGGSQSEFAITLLKTRDNGFLIGGPSSSSDGNISTPMGMYDFWIIKTDSLGNLEWEQNYGGTEDDYLVSMIEDSGSYVLAGGTSSNDGQVIGNHNTTGIFKSDYWIIKIDSLGNLIWQKCFGGYENEVCRSIVKTFDGGYIATGYAESNDGDVTGMHNPGFGAQDMWIVKLDYYGNLEWQKCIGGSDGDDGYRILQLPDSSYIITGYTFSFDGDVLGGGNHGNGDAWIVKLSPSPLVIMENTENMDITAFYDALFEKIIVNFIIPVKEELLISIINTSGAIVEQQKMQSKENEKCILTFSGSYKSGIYFLRISGEKSNYMKKVTVFRGF